MKAAKVFDIVRRIDATKWRNKWKKYLLLTT
jgi:hypothetical protein